MLHLISEMALLARPHLASKMQPVGSGDTFKPSLRLSLSLHIAASTALEENRSKGCTARAGLRGDSWRCWPS